MAQSKCLGCGGTRFEMVENSPTGSQYKLMFVQCASCGGVVGVMDYYNVGQQNEKIKEGLKKFAGAQGVRLDL
ncbi:hypothetical protein [Paenibacillus pseudetheri]|uniref:Uncharacterized protein n=1 Tax=Paenibacillus pseudetheri TaxID=2897682 RepID=A0ABM9B682_9BACL|nr:hypothetical protein [Paenibacillus pseudetheri]CAH1053998.1 hypothetical protein PAECIP111894_00143 [Paenibacillus pseudetheri]